MKTPDDKKPSSNPALFACGCLVLPIALLFALFFGAMPYNSFRLWRLERNFAALPHPASSRFLKRQKMVGLVAGNGNHCDFFVAELRSRSNNRVQIRKFYNSVRVAVPNHDESQEVENGAQPVQIELLPSPLPEKYRWNFHTVDRWDLSDFAGQKELYIVLILNSGDNNSWDSMFSIGCG